MTYMASNKSCRSQQVTKVSKIPEPVVVTPHTVQNGGWRYWGKKSHLECTSSRWEPLTNLWKRLIPTATTQPDYKCPRDPFWKDSAKCYGFMSCSLSFQRWKKGVKSCAPVSGADQLRAAMEMHSACLPPVLAPSAHIYPLALQGRKWKYMSKRKLCNNCSMSALKSVLWVFLYP